MAGIDSLETLKEEGPDLQLPTHNNPTFFIVLDHTHNLTMGKSRKAKGKRAIDSRGYGQSSTTTKTSSSASSQANTTSKTSSSSAIDSHEKHENIKQLTEQLRNVEIQHQGGRPGGGEGPSTSTKTTTTTVVSSDRFVSRLKTIVHRLLELNFTEDQLDLVVEQLGYDITLETALDYLCLNVPTLELPPLFTDGKLRDSLRRIQDNNNKNGDKKEDGQPQSSNTLTVLKFATQQRQQLDDTVQDTIEKGLPKDDVSENNVGDSQNNDMYVHNAQPLSPPSDRTLDVRQKKEDDDAAERKAWLLQMYGDYEQDGEEEVFEGEEEMLVGQKEEGVHKKIEPQAEVNNVETTILEKSAEEIDLERKERELQELQDDVNNEANNYMRSKSEIKRLKQQCNMMKKDIAGLRRKVEKIKRETEAEAASVMATTTPGPAAKDDGDGEDIKPTDIFGHGNADDEDEDYGGNMFDLFGNTDDQPSANARTTSVPGGEPQPLQPSTLIDCPIPTSWTGTTPKKVLEETCKKKKLGQPKFSKRPTKSGYRLLVSTSKRAKTSEWIAAASDFSRNSSLQDYLAAQALYAVDPTVPVYLMFPPSLKDIWLSWLAKDKADVETLKGEEDRVDKERIQRLLSLINDKTVVQSLPVVSQDQKVESEVEPSSSPNQDMSDESWEDKSANDSLKPGTTVGVEAKKAREEFIRRQKSEDYMTMLQYRKDLPMTAFREQFLETVHSHPVTILCAETGAGKTTQCPQYILEEAILNGQGDSVNIVCTQPRRIAATSVAERVADEMCSKLGRQVGYQIRMESKKSADTRLLFCTTGVLLRRLTQNDNDLQSVSHIILDECHERQVEVDVLLIAIRHILQTTRRDLKIILMSASIDPTLFSNFFGGAPVVSVPGRTFPVSTYFLEDLFDATGHIIEAGSQYALRSSNSRQNDKTTLWVSTRGGEKRRETVDIDSTNEYDNLSSTFSEYSISTRLSLERVDETMINYDLIEDVLEHICIQPPDNRVLVGPNDSKHDDGAVLIFLPGIGEIKSISSRLASNRIFSDSSKFNIIPLHSKLSSAEQRKAFLPSKRGSRKIILSTNVAETSLTIPDVVVVIDSGRERELRRHQRTSTSVLVTDWVSRASAKQRAGRAGRVQPGICLKLYSSETANGMKSSTEPELKRVSLEQTCLLILSSRGFGDCLSFLRQAPQPPQDESIEAALIALEQVGATTGDRRSLTPLGQHLARLPVDVRIGKLLIMGALFNCLDSSLTIAASLSSKSPFLTYFNDADVAKAKHAVYKDVDSGSDLVTLCNVWDAFAKASGQSYTFCRKNYLDHAALCEISSARKEFLNLLSSIGFVSKNDAASFGSRAWDTCGANVNSNKWPVVHAVACAGLSPNFARLDASGPVVRLYQNQQEIVFHKSSINAARKRFPSDQQWVVFNDKFGTSGRVSVSVTCFVSPLPLLLFGSSVKVQHPQRKVVIEEWLEIPMPAQTAVTLVQLRTQIDALLEQLVRSTDRIDTHLMNEIAQILH